MRTQFPGLRSRVGGLRISPLHLNHDLVAEALGVLDVPACPAGTWHFQETGIILSAAPATALATPEGSVLATERSTDTSADDASC